MIEADGIELIVQLHTNQNNSLILQLHTNQNNQADLLLERNLIITNKVRWNG